VWVALPDRERKDLKDRNKSKPPIPEHESTIAPSQPRPNNEMALSNQIRAKLKIELQKNDRPFDFP
jgi:hypothetical protein